MNRQNESNFKNHVSVAYADGQPSRSIGRIFQSAGYRFSRIGNI